MSSSLPLLPLPHRTPTHVLLGTADSNLKAVIKGFEVLKYYLVLLYLEQILLEMNILVFGIIIFHSYLAKYQKKENKHRK